MPTSTPGNNPLDAIIAQYIEATERGEKPDRQDLMAAHPEHASELAEFFADYDRMQATHLQPTPDRDATFIPQHEPQPGTIFGGRYKLLQNIGEGGMGSVWVAEQKEPVKRKVAIKLVKAGMDSKQVLARFEAERQALAVMDHPNIAKVFDGGITEHGRPYFVMEYVKGVPFTEYCDKARLSLKERLNLFIPVCQAVQHAHHKGIVHRDLKPSNILICLYDGKPVPKVIDFGLAKALHQQLTEQSIFTAHGVMVGTPLYMSPEQAEHNNLDVDTRTDIYSLGVVLYELLTGTTPLEREQLRTAAYNEVLRLIKEVEPPRPSTRLSGSASLPSIAAQRSIDPRHLQKSVAGDLDWIVMKSLEKERSRRYETATSLARDVERFLNDEAVEACPPSRSYRLKKFIRKHKIKVIAASMVLSAMLVTIAAVTWGWRKATDAAETVKKSLEDVTKERDAKEEERRNALVAREKAEKAEQELFETFRDTTKDVLAKLIRYDDFRRYEDGRDPTELKREFLEATIKRWQVFADRQGDSLRSMNYRAEGLYTVGTAWDAIGGNSEAVQAYKNALAIREHIQAVNPENDDNLKIMVYILLGLCLTETEDESAVTYATEAVRISQSLAAPNSRSVEILRLQANCFNSLGAVLPAHRSTDAIAAILSSIANHDELAARDPGNAEYRYLAAIGHYNLAIKYSLKGEAQSQRLACETARNLSLKLVAEYPDNANYRFHLSSCHHMLGSIYEETADAAAPSSPIADVEALRTAAANEFQGAGFIRFELCSEFPDVLIYQTHHGATTCNYACLLFDRGQIVESIEYFDRAVGILDTALRKSPIDYTTWECLWISHYRRAMAYDRLQKYTDAAQDWRFAINLVSARSISEESKKPNVIEFRLSLAMSLVRANQIPEAVAEVDAIDKELFNSDAPSNEWTPDVTYKFAALHALASPHMATRQSEYLERAMTLLRKAIAAGYNTPEAAAQMATDPDLNPLRERDEFKQLLELLPKVPAPPADHPSPAATSTPPQP